MIVAIIGSRDYPTLVQVAAYVDSLPQDTEVISGGARGVDTVAYVRAKSRGLAVRLFRANWKQRGRKAGLLRNDEMVRLADKVVAFWDGKSRGTAYTVRKAREKHKDVEVYMPLEQEP